MADTQGYEGVVLPNFFGSPQDALQNSINLKERKREFDSNMDLQNRELANREAERKQIEDDQKLQFIQNQTDPSKHLTANAKIDFTSQRMLSDLYKKYIALAPSMSMGELRYRIESEVAPIAQGDEAAKTIINNEFKKIQAVGLKNKNVNTEQLYDDVLKTMGNDFISTNPQGEMIYNPIDKINLNKDYTGGLLSAPDNFKYSLGGQGLIDELRNQKGDLRTAYTGSETGVLNQWEGNITPYQEMNQQPDEKQFVKGEPKFNIKADQYNTVRDANGNPIKLLRQDAFDELTNSDERKLQFASLWEGYKKSNNIQTTPQTEDNLKKAFAYRLIENNVGNQMQIKNKTHLEPYKYLYGDFGNSAANSTVNDLFKSITDKVDNNNSDGGKITRFNSLNSDEQSIIMNFIKDNPNYGGGNVLLYKDANGDYGVYNAKEKDKGSGNFIVAPQTLITKLSRVGTNLKAQPDVGAKRKVVAEGDNTNTQPPKQETLAEKMRRLANQK
jgi:hypothetical protein